MATKMDVYKEYGDVLTAAFSAKVNDVNVVTPSIAARLSKILERNARLQFPDESEVRARLDQYRNNPSLLAGEFEDGGTLSNLGATLQ